MSHSDPLKQSYISVFTDGFAAGFTEGALKDRQAVLALLVQHGHITEEVAKRYCTPVDKEAIKELIDAMFI